MSERPWRVLAGGLGLCVRVTPRASKEAVAGGTPEHMAVRLRAPPVEGAANAALLALIASRFRVPRRAVRLVGGEQARIKRLEIDGDPAVLAGIAETLYGADHDS